MFVSLELKVSMFKFSVLNLFFGLFFFLSELSFGTIKLIYHFVAFEILGNQIEENCIIFIFRSIKETTTIKPAKQNSLNNNTKDSSFLSVLNKKQPKKQKYSQLLGFVEISFVKGFFFQLCEYFLHSVYDTKSLECFDLPSFLLENFIDGVELIDNELNKLTTRGSHFFHKIVYLKNRFLISKSCQFIENKRCSLLTFDFQRLDEKLSNAFKFIQLPNDWTILGQYCYLQRGLKNN